MPADLAAAVRELGLDIDEEALQRLERYRDAIARAAKEFNLTAVREPAAIERRPLLESLALGRLLTDRDLLEADSRILDLGSGADLPGLPLKIAGPGLRLSLLESNEKRCRFLREVVRELRLRDVDVLEGRAEEVARKHGQRASYDLVIARAVAPLPVLLEYALPFLRLGGHLAATKGSVTASEVETAGRALRELGGELEEPALLEPPGGQLQTVVIVTKRAETPNAYPRRTGVPAKRPLL